MRRAVLTGLRGALTALALLALASASQAAISPSELLADPDRFDGQAVTLQGTVEKFREGVPRDGSSYYKFRLSDEQAAVRVFSAGRSPCRNGMQATVDGIFEKLNRLGPRIHYQEVMATRVTCR
jgi:cytochrome c-type biogenesis protein CcmE